MSKENIMQSGREELAVDKLQLDAIDLTNRCILVTAGSLEDGFNTMTVNWGFFGTMWFAPTALLVIRPSRYTFEFIQKCDDFTLTILPPEYKDVYTLMGSKSGRNSDKMAANPLSPVASQLVKSPSFAEACFTMECKKWYVGDLQAEGILDQHVIQEDYANGDYHKMIMGKIVRAWKTDKF